MEHGILKGDDSYAKEGITFLLFKCIIYFEIYGSHGEKLLNCGLQNILHDTSCSF
jgi:hypothetical protein